MMAKCLLNRTQQLRRILCLQFEMSEFKYEGATMTIPMYQHTTMLDTTTDAVTVGIGIGQEDTANAVTGAVYVTEGSTDVAAAAAAANGTGAGNTAIDDVVRS